MPVVGDLHRKCAGANRENKERHRKGDERWFPSINLPSPSPRPSCSWSPPYSIIPKGLRRFLSCEGTLKLCEQISAFNVSSHRVKTRAKQPKLGNLSAWHSRVTVAQRFPTHTVLPVRVVGQSWLCRRPGRFQMWEVLAQTLGFSQNRFPEFGYWHPFFKARGHQKVR